MLSLNIKNNYLNYKKINFLTRYIYFNSTNSNNRINNNYLNYSLKENEEKILKDNNGNNKCNKNYDYNYYLNLINKQFNQGIIKYFNKIKINYNNLDFNKYYLNIKNNKIIFYSTLFGLSFITINLGFYIKRKRFENKLKENIYEIFNTEIYSKIDWETIKPIINNIIKEKIKSNIIIDSSMKDNVTQFIINYLKKEENKKIIFDIIKIVIHLIINGIGLNIFDFYNIINNKNDKQTMSLIAQHFETNLIKVLKSKKFEEYLNDILANIVHENLFLLLCYYVMLYYLFKMNIYIFLRNNYLIISKLYLLYLY